MLLYIWFICYSQSFDFGFISNKFSVCLGKCCFPEWKKIYRRKGSILFEVKMWKQRQNVIQIANE